MQDKDFSFLNIFFKKLWTYLANEALALDNIIAICNNGSVKLKGANKQ